MVNVLRALSERDIRLLIAGPGARQVSCLTSDESLEGPSVLRAQAARLEDTQWRLALARRLIAAKVANYCALAGAIGRPAACGLVADALSDLSVRCANADSIETLLGVEGTAAARWYRLFGQLLPGWMRFDRRVAPNATDPANILRNLAQTFLHRHIALALRGAGLAPTLGLVHTPRAGHAALASDLQEPFRHFMDRAVLSIAPRLRPGDFSATPHGEHPVSIAPAALRKAIDVIHRSLAGACVAGDPPMMRTYLNWLNFTARSRRGHLLDRNRLFPVFRHPVAPPGKVMS